MALEKNFKWKQILTDKKQDEELEKQSGSKLSLFYCEQSQAESGKRPPFNATIMRREKLFSTGQHYYVYSFFISGLQPSTLYYFDLEINGVLLSNMARLKDSPIFKQKRVFKTLPDDLNKMKDDESFGIIFAGEMDLNLDYTKLKYISRVGGILLA